MKRYWIAVACAEHVARGREQGFMQVCHGKRAPLQRLRPGDGVIYYSPGVRLGDNGKLQSFTAIGAVLDAPVYSVELGGFIPFRRDVRWFDARPAPIRPLLERLAWSRGKTHWGYPLRFGLFPIEAEDFRLIAQAMHCPGAGLEHPA